ncbi:MAG: MerR family transcriptional regulator [Albidovulum sp.]
MKKSAEAFRTISEASTLLNTPAHVLRFWESRFSQIKPVKRAGGRRYYRPADLALLGGIKKLLHEDGLTIRGVQKILRESGVRHVAGLSGADATHLDEDDAATPDAAVHSPPATTPPVHIDAAATPAPNADENRSAAAVTPFNGQKPRPAQSPGAERREALGQGLRAPEAPMQVDAPTLPLSKDGNIHSLDVPDTAAPAPQDDLPLRLVQPPAAKMLRAMDTLRARDKKSELMSVYLRLVDLRDRLSRITPTSTD